MMQMKPIVVTKTKKKVVRDTPNKYSEKLVDKYFKKAVEDAGGITFKNHPLTNAGIPDRIVHIKGRTFYVELKTTGERCTPLQIEFHKRLHKVGMQTLVLDTKIVDFYDMYNYCYTEYEDSNHYKKNPFKQL